MTLEIGLVLVILASAAVLFVTERVRVDVVALIVLLSLALSGLVTPTEALSGFANPAVVTVWAVFILSGGLTRTGVARLLGRYVLRLAGESEIGLVAAIMLSAGAMSAFMNNVGVAALLLPVVMDICRRTGVAPSKILIPLAFSSLLGGLVTLIGTPPNILISEAAEELGLGAFDLFDFTPVGLAVLLAGAAYMAFVGRHLLPHRGRARPVNGNAVSSDLSELWNLKERLNVLRLPQGSALAGRTLGESRLGSALDLHVVGIRRGEERVLAPGPTTVLRAEDRLVVQGELEALERLRKEQRYLDYEEESRTVVKLFWHELGLLEVRLPGSRRVGRTLRQLDFRPRFGLNVLAIWRDGKPYGVGAGLPDVALAAEDVLLVLGSQQEAAAFADDPSFTAEPANKARYSCEELLMIVHLPEDSPLLGKTLPETRLGDAFGLTVLGIVRDGTEGLLTRADVGLAVGDILLIAGQPEDLAAVHGLRDLELDLDPQVDLGRLETHEIALAEVVIAPRTTLAGRTIRGLHFREKYGLTALAILRDGKVTRREVRSTRLKFGDALLLYGARRRLRLLGGEPDFIVLTEEAEEPLLVEKAPVAAAVMAAVLLPVILGWMPIYIAAIGGATLMVLLRCLTMDEAYQFIDWRAVFLIAGMLPLGVALQKSGAARFLTEGVVATVGGLGPLWIVAALYLVTAFAAQVMPTAAVAILMAPIAFNTAQDLGLSPYALLMTVSLSASASFMSPVAHPANVLIMGPGGYRFADYIKVGLPLTVVCLVVVLLVLPRVWPLT